VTTPKLKLLISSGM